MTKSIIVKDVHTGILLYQCIQSGRTALDIAEAKGHTQIVAILKTAIESEFEVEALATSEGDIAAKDEESKPSASGGDLEETTRIGVFGKVRDWFQRNTKEIRLVSITVLPPLGQHVLFQLLLHSILLLVDNYCIIPYRAEQRYVAQ